jgi:hypothetical protein
LALVRKTVRSGLRIEITTRRTDSLVTGSKHDEFKRDQHSLGLD